MSNLAPIAPGLRAMAVPIEDLYTWERNPRKGDVAAVVKSLEGFGQRTPVVYRTEKVRGKRAKQKVVYAGNHRLLAARELGWTHLAAVAADDLTPEQIRGFALADNRTSDLGTYDGDTESPTRPNTRGQTHTSWNGLWIIELTAKRSAHD